MITEVVIPFMSEANVNAFVYAWHKKQGELVWRDELLVEIETDKVVYELRADSTGILEIVATEQTTVLEGMVVAKIHERYYTSK